MIIGFDLDGTLDRLEIRLLARSMMRDGYEIHVISGIFDEAGDWQGEAMKDQKLARMGLQNVHKHYLHAVPETFPIDYRLRDLGLRKGAVCAEHGIQIMFDDNEQYCALMPKMCGTQIVQVHP